MGDEYDEDQLTSQVTIDEEKMRIRKEKRRLSQIQRRSKQSEEKKRLEREKGKERETNRREKMKEEAKPSISTVLRMVFEMRRMSLKDASLKELLHSYRHVTLGRWFRANQARVQLEHQRASRRSLHAARKKERAALHSVKRSDGFSKFLQVFSTFVACARDQKQGDMKELLSRVKKRCEVAWEIERICREEIPNVCARLRRQMAISSVHHPSCIKNEKEKVHRSVCRVAYHVVNKDTPGARPLDSIYPTLYRQFMRIAEKTGEEAETDRMRTQDVRIMLQLLAPQVEEEEEAEEQMMMMMLLADDAPDGENVGIEELIEDVGEEVGGYEGEVGEIGLEAEAEEVLLQDPELREAAGPHGAYYAPKVTYATACTCRRVSFADACKLKDTLTRLADAIENGDYMEMAKFEINGLDALKRNARCYSGLRSILSRIYALRALVNLIHVVEYSFGRSKTILNESIERSDWKWLPKAVRAIIESTFEDDENTQNMTEAAVQLKFGKSLNDMANKVRQTENVFCDICTRAREQSQPPSRPDMRAEREADVNGRMSICSRCMDDARSGKGTKFDRQQNPQMPRYSVMNNVDLDEVPPELQDLNWIEQTLIQLVRPIRSIVCLNDAGGRKTSMPAAGGAMVLLPVPTEGSLQHVAETLPSDAGLTILVSPEAAKSKLVRLPKILRALRWLKDNNHLYSNITINSAFQFTRDSVIFTRRDKAQGPTRDQELADLITDDENAPTLLRYEEIAPQVIRPMHGQTAAGVAHEQYALLKNPYEPMTVDTPHLEAKCFPWHFCTGRFGVHAARQKKLSLREMSRWWLASKDRRCARDPQFLAFVHGLLQQIDMTSALGIQARLSRGALTGETFLKALSEGNTSFEGSFHAGARVMRGHVAYFDMKRKEARAHVALFGPATFFLTLNPAERRWEEVGDLYAKVYGPEVTKNNLFQYISRDPYWFARCFQQRLRTIFRLLLLSGGSNGGPLGKVIHHFVRIEYQHRGTQHAHCMLWVEGAPPEQATDQERVEFIDKFLCARLPDESTEPELHEIIKNEQMHYEHHSQTCIRPFKIKGKTSTRCRFDFPRPCTSKTMVNKESDRLQALPGTRLKKYYLKRRNLVIYIVTRFRVAVIQSNGRRTEAAGDEQEEAEEQDEGSVGAPRPAQSRNSDPFAPHFNVHCRASPMYDHDRNTAANYIITGTRPKKAHVLLGRPLVPRFFWPNLEENNEESREDYYRRLCFLFIPWRNEDELMGNAETYEAKWAEFVAHVAIDEPEALADIKKIIEHQEALLTQDKEVTEKRKAQRALLNSMRVDEDPETDGPVVFDRNVDEEKLAEALSGMNAGQKKLFDEIVEHIQTQHEHTVRLEEIRADRNMTPVQRHEELKKHGKRPEALLRVVVGTAGCGKSFLINALADHLTLTFTTPEKRATEPAVVLAAPTGLAAVQIRGSTLHSLLGIEVQHGRDVAIRPLNPLRLNGLRLQFRNVRLLIVDELSMMSSIVLTKVHMRLMDIMGNSELFGGINILLLGDLMQLPPVAAPPIFEKLTALTVNRLFGSMLPELCLFDLFSYDELTENMRQQGDQQFGELLQRLRVQALTDEDEKVLRTRIIKRSRSEKPIEAAARKLVELMQGDESTTPMALFSTNAEVRCFNQQVVGLLQLNSCIVDAEDSFVRKPGGRGGIGASGKKGKTRRVYQDAEYDVSRRPGSRRFAEKRRKMGNDEEEADESGRTENDTNKAAGLEKHLLLAENGRVMLWRNLNAAAGLVNGACGVLKKIVKSADGEVIGLVIAFDGLNEELIEKASATFDISDDEQQTRRQFPVSMAFGATIHKAQGMTLSAVIVSTANFFGSAPAQGFVAFSRVRTLNTLYLVDLHMDKLRCSRAALTKYNELRSTVGLPQFAQPTIRRRGAAAANGDGEQEEEQTTADGADGSAQGSPPPSTPRRGAPTPSRGSSSAKLRVPLRSEGETPRNRQRATKRRRAGTPMDDEEQEVLRKRKQTDAPQNAERRNLAEEEPTLTLRNTGTDCYMIAAMNLIFSVPVLKNGIIAAAPLLEEAGQLSARMMEVVEILKGNRTDVIGLRTAASFPIDWGDARDSFYPMLQDFPEAYYENCTLIVTVKLSCPNSHVSVELPDTMFKIRLEAQKLPLGYESGTIEDIYKKTCISEVICEQCGAGISEADVAVEASGSLVIVEVNRSVYNGLVRQADRPLRIDGCHAKRMKVFGTPMRMVACMQHIAWDNGDRGHYVVWRRSSSGAGWVIIDDDHALRMERQLPNKMSGIHIIVFEVL